MPIVTEFGSHYKAEFYGNENSGKSYTMMSICELINLKSEKKKIIFFTNESNYEDVLDDWDEYREHIIVFFHHTLEEFESDWEEFKTMFGIEPVTNPRTGLTYLNTYRVQKEVHAIILDEAEFLYREGYVERTRARLAKGRPDFRMEPKYYGEPRSHFIIMLKALFTNPCHVLIASKVGTEYEEVRVPKADGSKTYLTFVKTGEDTYRLPDNSAYEPNLRCHLFRTTKESNKLDEAGDPIKIFTFFGRVVKNKVNRQVEPLLKMPTMKKFRMLLAQMALEKKKKGR